MNKSMQWIVFLIFHTTIVFGQEILDGLAAVVNNEIVLRSEWMQTAQGLAVQAGFNPMTDIEKFEQLKKDVLLNMINNKIFIIKAEEDTIIVEDQQVETALNERITNLVEQLGSESQVESYFGMPISQIKKENRQTIREQLIVQKVQAEKLQNVQISRHEVEKFFETYKDSLPEKQAMVHLRHILMEIKASSDTRQRAMSKIDEIRARLLKGDSFEDLARTYSEDPGTAKLGGSLGYVEKGMLFESFDQIAFSLEPGEISDVVETPVGLHLVQLVDKKEEKANLRHILIRMEMTGSDEDYVHSVIQDLRNRISNGEDFAELATEYSDDPSSRSQGGNLGWLPVEYLQIAEFRDVVENLEVNEVSDVFRTQFGFHIVKIEGRRQAGSLNMKEDWDRIRGMALDRKQDKILKEWVKELRSAVHIRLAKDIDLDLSIN